MSAAADSYAMNLVSGLGYWDQADVFRMNEERCLKSLKRLRRQINADAAQETTDTALLLGKIRIMKVLGALATDYGKNDLKLLVEITKVIVQLTMPLGSQDKTLDRSTERLNQLRGFKYVFLQDGLFSTFMKLLDGPIAGIGSDHREEDKMLVELVLYLIRNLLAIPDAPVHVSKTASHESHLMHLHEDFLLMMERSNVFLVLIFLAQYVGDEGNQRWNVILLEIFYLVFRDAEPEDFFVDQRKQQEERRQEKRQRLLRGEQERQRDNARLEETDELAISLKTSRAKRISAKKGLSSRHSRFGGLVQLGGGSKPSASSSSSIAVGDNPKNPGDDNDNIGDKSNKKNGGKFVFKAKQQVLNNAFELSNRNNRSIALDLKQDLGQRKKRRARKKHPDDLDEGTSLVEVKHDHILRSQGRSLSGSHHLRRVQGKLCAEFVDKCYKPLFENLKRDFRRDDAKIIAQDHYAYLWLSGLCIGYERMRVETEGKSESYAWHESPIIVTMDRYSFHYAMSMSHNFAENVEKDKELEVCTFALGEMAQVLCLMGKSLRPDVRAFGEKLRNRVLSNMKELELVPTMLRNWTPARFSWCHLAKTASLGNTVLQLATKMAQEGVVVTRTTKRRSSNFKKFGVTWTPDETLALQSAVNDHGVTIQGFKKVLNDEVIGKIFDKTRTPMQLYNRWEHISKSLRLDNIDLDTFIQQELNRNNEEQEMELAAAAEKAEAADIEEYVRPYDTNPVIKNLIPLLDPEMIPSHVSQRYVANLHENVMVTYLKHFVDDNIGKLWYISYFSVFRRALATYTAQTRPKLVPLLKMIVSHFFESAKENPLLLAELLFQRGKTENRELINHYESAMERKIRLEEEEFNAEKKHDDDDDDDDVHMKDGDASKGQQQRKRKIPSEDELSEEEADFDTVKFCGITKEDIADNGKLRGKTKRVPRPDLPPWSKRDTEDLLNALLELNNNTETRTLNGLYNHVITMTPSLKDRFSETAIKHEIARLGISCKDPNQFDEDEEQQANIFKNRDMQIIASHLSREARPFLQWVAVCLDTSGDDDDEMNHSRVMVPVSEEQFEWLEMPAVAAFLELLGCNMKDHVYPHLPERIHQSAFNSFLEQHTQSMETEDQDHPELEAVLQKQLQTNDDSTAAIPPKLTEEASTIESFDLIF